MKDYLSFYRIRKSKTDERRKTGDLKSDLRSPIESEHFDAELDYKSAQESRFGDVHYSDAMIKAFAKICTMPDIYKHGVVELHDETKRVILRFDKG